MFRPFLPAIRRLCVHHIKHKRTCRFIFLRACSNNLSFICVTVKIIKRIKCFKTFVIGDYKTVNASGISDNEVLL